MDGVKVTLPDFDDLVALTGEVKKSQTNLLLAKAKLDRLKALITKKATQEEKYWVNGRVPSMAFIESNYHVNGLNPQTRKKLHTLQDEIAELAGDLKSQDLLFQVYQDMIGVWRTEAANKRGAFYDG